MEEQAAAVVCLPQLSQVSRTTFSLFAKIELVLKGSV